MSKQYLDDPPPEQLIFDAVARGDAAAVESLLTDDPRLIVARGGWQLYRPLFFALHTGQDATIDVLKRHGATLDIFEATALGDIAALRTLLSAAPELANARREHYDATPLHAGDPHWTPLHHAAWRNHAPAVSWLLEHGADPTRVNKYGSTPLQTASHFGHLEIVKILSAS